MLGAIPFADAQTESAATPGTGAKPGIVLTDRTAVKARVESIDYTNRTVVLRGEEGQIVTLKVGPDAKNFDQVKLGDVVNADFYGVTAIFVRKSGEPPTAQESQRVAVAAPGEPRAGGHPDP